jgi:hypothetical protein
MALPWLNGLQCVIFIRGSRRNRKSELEALEKNKRVVERMRTGVSVEAEYDIGEMMGGTWTGTRRELLSTSYSDIAVSTNVVATMTTRE